MLMLVSYRKSVNRTELFYEGKKQIKTILIYLESDVGRTEKLV